MSEARLRPAIRCVDLGLVPPVRSQTVYHAVAQAMRPGSPDTIILVAPQQPYVCIGFHQDAELEVDLAYCRAHGLPVIRREVGGGAVYLDQGQVFAQWVFQRAHVPADVEARFAWYIRPLVETYRALGIEAYLRPANDIHVAGKKIGGTGAAEIGEAQVLVGSLMFTFDKATMARVLKVSSEKMRDKITASLEQYMTTMAEQLGQAPERQAVVERYLEQCAELLGAPILAGDLTPAEERLAEELDAQFLGDEWLHSGGGRRRLEQPGVTIHADASVAEAAYKAPGGLIRATVRLHGGQVEDVALSGDFTLLPATALGALEEAARGAAIDRPALAGRFAEVYRQMQLVSPGVTPEDFAEAVARAAE